MKRRLLWTISIWAVFTTLIGYWFVFAPGSNPYEIVDNNPRWYWGVLLTVPISFVTLLVAVTSVIGYTVARIGKLKFPAWANLLWGLCIAGVIIPNVHDRYLRSNVPVYALAIITSGAVVYGVAWSIAYVRLRRTLMTK